MEEHISKCDAVVNFAAESHVDRSINTVSLLKELIDENDCQ